MYSTLIFFHSLLRWFVLATLLYALFGAYQGFVSKTSFTKMDNAVRHWTATTAHIQLMVGLVLYFQSPIISYFRKNLNEGVKSVDTLFFGLIHPVLMLSAIVVLTIGSAKAKRKGPDKEKFKTMLVWYSIALFLIFVAIPWPFSPLANRPYFR